MSSNITSAQSIKSDSSKKCVVTEGAVGGGVGEGYKPSYIVQAAFAKKRQSDRELKRNRAWGAAERNIVRVPSGKGENKLRIL